MTSWALETLLYQVLTLTPNDSFYQLNFRTIFLFRKLHNSVGSVQDLRTRGRWFDPGLGQNSFPGLMIVIATGRIPLSPLSVVLTMVMWQCCQWLGKIIVRCTCEKQNPGKYGWVAALTAAI